MIDTLRQLADYGIAFFLIGGIILLTFYWLKHMIPSWKEEKAADAELKRSMPQLAESLKQVAEYQREISRSQEGILAWSERIRKDFEEDSRRKDEKLDELLVRHPGKTGL